MDVRFESELYKEKTARSMKGRKTFPMGGIHPPEKKNDTHHGIIGNTVISSVSIVPMLQHLGSPAQCLVNPEEIVREAMLIGKATGFVSSNVHSPIPGRVKEVKDIFLPTGIRSQAVVIEIEGEFDRTGKKQEKYAWQSMSPQDLLTTIADMGVVGAGGATFPTQVKFSLPKGSQAEYLIINGAECEPYLTADHRLMVEKPAEIVEGIRIIRKILNPSAVVIGIEENKPDAIETLEKAVKEAGLDAKVVVLKMKYPQGDEKQLIKAITGREVPSGGLPIAVGTVVSNVGTVFAIYEAVVLKKPFIERVLTVSGGAVKHPGNYRVRIGTPIRALLEECGGFTEEPARIVIGGPMMGFTVYDLDTPVTKGTSGILALTKRETHEAKQTPCIQCGRCIRSCPIGLHPTRLYKSIDHLDYDRAEKDGLLDCRECGCCAFICPAHIPLVQGMRLGKRMIRNRKAKT